MSAQIPTIAVEPLHPGQHAVVEGNQLEAGHGKMNAGAKGFLMKKMAAGGYVQLAGCLVGGEGSQGNGPDKR